LTFNEVPGFESLTLRHSLFLLILSLLTGKIPQQLIDTSNME
jgi:hypothetical protein